MKAAAALGLALSLGCAAVPPDPVPEDPSLELGFQREAYAAFMALHPGLNEPNYLPFMTWAVQAPPPSGWAGLATRLGLREGPPADRRRILCRWDESALPLRVHIVPPVIETGEELVRPRPPEAYLAAAGRALRIWERDLEGRIRFVSADRPEDASLTLRLIGEQAPIPDPGVKVLGTTPVKDACRVVGPGDGTRVEVAFRIPELRVYIADEFGPLLPDQVERLVLHEVGHALGMRQHSPIPADLMFAVARDRISREGLGAEDVNSFLALYDLPNGTVFYDAAAPPPPDPRPRLPAGLPQLDLAPHVDSSRGFEVQVPRGWLRLTTPYGVVMVNGTPWDSEASLQVNMHRFDTIEEYLERYGRGHLGASRFVSEDHVRLAGKRARSVVLHTRHGTQEELSFVESGDGRVLVVIAECPADLAEAYAPWFRSVRASLYVSDDESADEDRSYSR